jgi:hypothetical protein
MKSKGLAIFFGLLPGCGHMYLGKMKRGMTLMIAFWGALALSAFLGTGAVALAMPVIWFYSFFDVMNLAGMTRDQFDAVPDQFAFGLFDEEGFRKNNVTKWFSKKKNIWIGWAFIIVGILVIYNNFAYPFFSFLAEFFETNLFYQIYYSIPQTVVAIIIICLGVHFIRGGKKQKPLPLQDEIPLYRDSDNSQQQ